MRALVCGDGRRAVLKGERVVVVAGSVGALPGIAGKAGLSASVFPARSAVAAKGKAPPWRGRPAPFTGPGRASSRRSACKMMGAIGWLLPLGGVR